MCRSKGVVVAELWKVEAASGLLVWSVKSEYNREKAQKGRSQMRRLANNQGWLKEDLYI